MVRHTVVGSADMVWVSMSDTGSDVQSLAGFSCCSRTQFAAVMVHVTAS